MVTGIQIRELTHADQSTVHALANLLRDSVENGASVGYVIPITDAEIQDYWRGVLAAQAAGDRVLLLLEKDGTVLGSAQLDCCGKPNGRHRAEVQKVLVHSAHRGQGFGRTLMTAIEAAARRLGRTLLVLDTETGSAGQHLYAALGYTAIGEIPEYAIATKATESAARGKVGSTFMYKILQATDAS